MSVRSVLVLGSFDPVMTRNRQLLRLLGSLDVDVRVRHVPVWSSERLGDATGSRWRLALRVAWGLVRIGVAFLRSPRPDVLLVPYPGHFDMFVLGPLARLRRVPVVLEFFISLHETTVLDRGLVQDRSWVARVTRAADRWSIRWSTLVLADTPEDAAFFASLAGVAPERCRVVWIGADPAVFHPVSEEAVAGRVLFYGTYIPLHGTDTIVRAAAQLGGDGVTVRMIGSGQLRDEIEQLARSLDAPVEFVDTVDEAELPLEIARAQLCLGIFDGGPKAARVVPNKVFQVLAVGRPCITAETPAVRAALGDAVVCVPPEDPGALALAISGLLGDEARSADLLRRGRELMDGPFSESQLADRLGGYLDEAVAAARSRG